MFKRLRYIIVFIVLLFTAMVTAGQVSMPDTVCIGTTRLYSVNDATVPSTYIWKIDGVTQSTTTHAISITWSTPGTFLLTVQERNAAGCEGDIRAGTVTVNPLNTLILNKAICSNQLPFIWNGNPYSITGTYLDTLINITGGCDTAAVLNLTVSATPNLTITDPAGVCAPATVNLTAASITAGSDAGLTFTYWTDISATSVLSNPDAVNTRGTYYIKATNAAGCSTMDSVHVNINPAPTILLSNSETICSGAGTKLRITFTGTAPFTFTYSDGLSANTVSQVNSNTYEILVNPRFTTTYAITNVVDAYCSSTGNLGSAVITVIPPLQPIRYPTVTTQAFVPTPLSARNFGSNNTYTWNPVVGLNSASIVNPVFNYDRPTEYTIVITANNGCTVVDTVLVKVSPVSAPLFNEDIFVPKAWTPNGDGHNDYLRPLTVNIKEIRYFRIFNRWGQLVYETNVIGQGWDGIFKGKPGVMDVYTWTAEAIGLSGKIIRRSGNSALLR